MTIGLLDGKLIFRAVTNIRNNKYQNFHYNTDKISDIYGLKKLFFSRSNT